MAINIKEKNFLFFLSIFLISLIIIDYLTVSYFTKFLLFNSIGEISKIKFDEESKKYLEYLDQFEKSKEISNKSLIMLDFHLVKKVDYKGKSIYLLTSSGFGRCISNYLNKKNKSIIMYDKENKLFLSGRILAIMGGCPWGWASHCLWNAFAIHFEIPEEIVDSLNDITILNLYTRTKTDVTVKKPFLDKKKEKFTICVPPLYFYNNLLQLFISTEIWRLQGVTKIFYYYTSISQDVLNLLKYYESEGIVTIIPYKSLPKNDIVDPNKSIYRYGHVTAINDCLNRFNSEYTTALDVDELLCFIRNNTFIYDRFIEIVNEIYNNKTNLAGIIFKHFNGIINTNFLNNDFNFLKNIIIRRYNRPTKYILRTERALTLESHFPSRRLPKFKLKFLNQHNGMVIHFRCNRAFKNVTKGLDINFILHEDLVKIRKRFLLIQKKINILDKFEYNLEVLKKIGACIRKWKSKKCKVVDELCKNDVWDLDDWVTSDTNNETNSYNLI